MDLSNLRPAKGASNRPGKRVGRGQGSGKGVVLLQEVITVRSHDRGTLRK